MSARSNQSKKSDSQLKVFAALIHIPIIAWLFIPNIYDSHGIPRLIALGILTLIALGSWLSTIRISKITQVIPFLIVLNYLGIQAIQKNEFNDFLQGSFNRGSGLISVLSLALIFLVISNNSATFISTLPRILTISVVGLLIYFPIEYFGLTSLDDGNQYQDSLQLTLTNPNIASAYLGIAAACLIVIWFNDKNNKIRNLILLAILIYLIYRTQSIQGYLVMTLGIFIIFLNYRGKVLSKFRNMKFGSYFIIVLLSVTILLSLNKFIAWFIANGSVKQRINYWELAWSVFKDQPLGVGLDNFKLYATRYRTEKLVLQEGIFTIPDRAHNVFLDNLVNGGLIGGILWFTFVLMISLKAIKLIINVENLEGRRNLLIVVTIWFGYLLQSLISIDHIALMLLGYSAGAIIVGFNDERNLLKPSNRFFMNIKMGLFSIYFFGVILFTIYAAQIISFNTKVFNYIYLQKTDGISKILTSRFISTQSLEDLAVKVSQAKEFELANSLAQKLLQHRPTSHQSHYIFSVYLESKGQVVEAREEMKVALSLDKYNSVYTIAMAIYEYKLGNYQESRRYLDETIRLDPKQRGIEVVTDLLAKVDY